jgi:hypothetical protein
VNSSPHPDAWADWPDTMTALAHQVVFHIGAGHAATAVALLDEMLADLESRRRTAAELANSQD